MLELFKNYARKEGDSAEMIFQKMLIMIISSLMCILGIVWGIIYYGIFGFGSIVIIAFTYTIILSSAAVIGHYLKNHFILVHTLFVLTVALPASIQFIIGSLDNSGMVISWCFMGALGSLIFLSVKHAVGWMAIFLLIVVYTIHFDPAILGYKLEVSVPVMKLQYTMNIVASYTVIFASAAWFVHTIKIEKSISEELLLNILPKDVAEELKITGDTRAKAFTMVTVMFTDFEGFTNVSKRVSAELLVDEIHYCFSGFDRIIQNYKIEKIKTIGDAYLCASGLPISNYTHAVDMLHAAFEMRDFMLERKREKEAKGEIPFLLRIGIHTGPVVAGIVGVRKFQYDIWGDTVNTANRVESSGEAGKVNISQSTYELLKDNAAFSFESRGKIEVKGKVGLDMYFVESVTPQAGRISKAS